MKSIPPDTPLLYSKTGVFRGMPSFRIFDPRCGYSLEPSRRGGFNVSIFLAKILKIYTFFQ